MHAWDYRRRREIYVRSLTGVLTSATKRPVKKQSGVDVQRARPAQKTEPAVDIPPARAA